MGIIEGQEPPPDWAAAEVFSRREAAEFLRVSVRTLDRLRIPRTYVGRSPKYLREDLLRFLLGRRVEGATDGSMVKPPPRLTGRPGKAERNWLRSRLDRL